MKKYNVKYEVGEEVYVLKNKTITQAKINKIRVTEQQPYTRGNSDGTLTEKSGIEIDYLIQDSIISFGANSSQRTYNWYNEEDVFTNKDELIAQIV